MKIYMYKRFTGPVHPLCKSFPSQLKQTQQGSDHAKTNQMMTTFTVYMYSSGRCNTDKYSIVCRAKVNGGGDLLVSAGMSEYRL